MLGHVNRLLARHGRRLGPDPASTDIACVGGVVANNSGGMRCGVHADSYRTVRSMTLVLANGAVIDTAAADAEQRFAAAAPELASGLEQIRDELRADAELAERVARKFEIKNTTGYRLCAFLDADTPLEIFRRLIVGSEGTLAFVAEAVFDTVALGRHTTLALVLFEDIDAAAAAVPELVAAGASATELMVAPTLIAAAWNMPGTPESWKELPPTAAALLVEFRAEDAAELDAAEGAALAILAAHAPLQEPRFTRERHEVEMLWHVREGMQGLLAAIRPPGACMIIEDVCVPPARIAEAAKDLQALLGKHGFLPGVAGHASAGNLHFLLTPNFAEPADLERYEAFMGELVELIVDKYDGSLKAEHGTGINMAPYVEREWGAKATELMWRVKRLADPAGILGPGDRAHPRPGRAPAQPEVHARDRGGRDQVHRVRLLRAGLPEPRAHDARRASGSSCGARWPASRPARRCSRRCSSSTSTTRSRRAPRTAPAPSPARSASTPASWSRSCARASTASAGNASRSRSPSAGAPSSAPRARGCGRGRAAGERPMRALSELARSAVSHELIPAWSPAMPGPAPAPAARCRARRRRRRVLPGVHQPDLRQPARARGRAGAARGAGRRLRPRRPAAVDPRRRRRALLRHAVELEGLRPRP